MPEEEAEMLGHEASMHLMADGFVCAGCSKGPETAAAYRAAFDAMVEALENLPVEEWIEQDPRDGSAHLIGYVMQAQGEWDNARTALQAARIARGDA